MIALPAIKWGEKTMNFVRGRKLEVWVYASYIYLNELIERVNFFGFSWKLARMFRQILTRQIAQGL